ncbi:Uncharacterised protein [Acinetobacter baumannii]|jgi:ferredoxin-thioredoxin reductase catalytic subunit|uniref:TniQ family protein n=1 Tax=Acinetobacter TaxID=469 RepID=UPI000BBBA1A9|nr:MULTISPECIES: TniQ family protein [Acinetobacter]ELS4592032.1 TniQ family protein [Acinetobacter baumannii]MBJ8465356.1 TniQ family protein [Acinetobacter nosocomialis]MBT1522682.1 TniQ family protein [Acinetobacter pittii]MCH7381806.1 TniQ family protein [Acinetobacter higginsii]MDA3578684.1 TniQ family protein [Acinetobacter ursingii]
MKHSLLRSPHLIDDETLSSWLVRTALYQGCDPMVLSWRIWDKYRIWTIDFERNLAHEHLLALSKATGLQIDVLDQMLLIHLAKKCVHEFHAESAIWSWILCQGIRNRKKSVGQQYCPHCLAEGIPYLRKEWRMAWATVCTKHQISLQDSCPECGFYFLPHKLQGLEHVLCICHHCGFDLRNSQGIEANSAFQKAAQAAIQQGYINCGTNFLLVAEWFAVAKVFVLLLRKAAAHKNGRFANIFADLGVSLETLVLPKTVGTFEWLPIAERHGLLRDCYILLQQPLEKLIDTAQLHSLSANAILNVVSQDKLPQTLFPLVNGLERQSKNYSKRQCKDDPVSEKIVMRKWARLQRKVQRIIAS